MGLLCGEGTAPQLVLFSDVALSTSHKQKTQAWALIMSVTWPYLGGTKIRPCDFTFSGTLPWSVHHAWLNAHFDVIL